VKIIVTAAAFLAATFVTLMVAIFGLLSLAGPHSLNPLSKSGETIAYVLFGTAVVIVPIVVAVATWRAMQRRSGA